MFCTCDRAWAGSGRGAEGEVLKVDEHLEVEDAGLGGALGGAGAGAATAGGLGHRLRGRRCLLALLRPRGPRPRVVGGLELAFRSGKSVILEKVKPELTWNGIC